MTNIIFKIQKIFNVTIKMFFEKVNYQFIKYLRFVILIKWLD